MLLEAKMMVEYIWVPEIMTDDWVCKGQTKLSMYSVFGEQIKRLLSYQLTLNFWVWLHPKFALLCCLLTQTATLGPNHQILTSSVKAILKALTDTFFVVSRLEVVRIFLFRLWGFNNKREYSRAHWLDILMRIWH